MTDSKISMEEVAKLLQSQQKTWANVDDTFLGSIKIEYTAANSSTAEKEGLFTAESIGVIMGLENANERATRVSSILRNLKAFPPTRKLVVETVKGQQAALHEKSQAIDVAKYDVVYIKAAARLAESVLICTCARPIHFVGRRAIIQQCGIAANSNEVSQKNQRQGQDGAELKDRQKKLFLTSVCLNLVTLADDDMPGSTKTNVPAFADSGGRCSAHTADKYPCLAWETVSNSSLVSAIDSPDQVAASPLKLLAEAVLEIRKATKRIVSDRQKSDVQRLRAQLNTIKEAGETEKAIEAIKTTTAVFSSLAPDDLNTD